MTIDNLLRKARQKLLELGFKSSDIYNEYRFNNRYVSDIVVLHEGNPYLVIELKGNDENITNLDYKFDPAVRQAQAYANILKAPFYSVFNGNDFFWFTTDSNGRPESLEQLYVPISNSFQSIDEIKKSLLDLRNYASHSLRLWEPDQLLILFYAQILDEIGVHSVKSDFLNGTSDDLDLLYPFDINSYNDRESLQEVFYKLERIKYSDIDPKELLLILDEIFFLSRNLLNIPRWLSDFMVKLSDIENANHVVDFFSVRGDFVASVLHNVKTPNNIDVKAFCLNNKNEYWLKIQELLLSRKEINHIYINPFELYKGKFSNQLPDRIFMAPYFGGNSNYISDFTGQTLKDNLEILIDSALEQLDKNGIFVCIVPNSFLYGKRFKNSRQLLRENGSLLGVISLPNVTFKPYAQINTSILVYEKGKSKRELFIGSLNDIPIKDTFNSDSHKSIKTISENFLNWLYDEKHQVSSDDIIIIPNKNVDYDDLSSIYSRKTKSYNSKYNLLPLVDICSEIRKGASVKLDNKGNVPFINPASIRELFIDDSKLGLTNEINFDNKFPRVQKNDIVVNSISTYRGAAALVKKDHDGLLVNNQVIILRPITDIVLPEYLTVIFNSKYIQEQIKIISSGAVISFIPLNLLRELMIPIPPIPIQKIIIEEIEKAKTKLKDAETIYRKASIELTELLRNFNVEKDSL